MIEDTTIFECRKISKTFPGVKALTDINFKIKAGEIHGLIGANGAGKSTLMKIISGIYTYDNDKESEEESGLYLEGNRVEFKGPAEAIEKQIILIHQELTVIPDLMVYENVFINSQIKKNGLLDRKEMISATKKMINDFDVDLKPTDKIKDLSVDNQKLVEVLRAISLKAKILIMDEPTSMLTSKQAIKLFETVKRIVAKNKIGVVLISHNLNEIKNMCDNITVLRDGKYIGTYLKKDVTVERMIELMLGRKCEVVGNKVTNFIQDEILLEVKNLHYKNKLTDISFELKKGEIIGLTGLVGSGGSILSKVLFGCSGYKKSQGSIKLKGVESKISSPRDAINNHMALLTEDRKGEGLILKFSIFENITIPSLKKYSNAINLLKRKKRKEAGDKYFPLLSIKAPSSETIVETLSGGNQQKIVIAKWLETNPDIIIFNEPTIGIDVGAKSEIRKLIEKIASEGKGVILITKEIDELKSLCDNVYIMFRGKIVKELSGDEISEKEILKYSMGGKV